MKQFITCTVFSLFIYLIGSILAESFNPIEWSNKEATLWCFFFIFVVWFFPIALNYLNGEENFK